VTSVRELSLFVPNLFPLQDLQRQKVWKQSKKCVFLPEKKINMKDERKKLHEEPKFEVDDVEIISVEDLGQKGYEYEKAFQDALDNGVLEKNSNINWIFVTLDKLSIEDGYVLDYYEWGEEIGSRCELYVHRKNAAVEYKPDLAKREERSRRLFLSTREKEKLEPFEDYIAPYNDNMFISMMLDFKESKQIPPIWGYLTVPFTPMGIWQAFLLSKAYTLLPKNWHGNYNNINIIYDKIDILSLFDFIRNVINQNEIKSLSKYLETDELLPNVEVKEDTAVISYTFWSAWGGFKKVSVPVKKDGKTVSFGEASHETLIKYDCGLRF